MKVYRGKSFEIPKPIRMVVVLCVTLASLALSPCLTPAAIA